MPVSSINTLVLDPYKNFKFKIKCDGRYVAGIGEVSALKQTTEVVKNWSVDDSGSLRISSGRLYFDAITLKRGITHDHEFEQWANNYLNTSSGLDNETPFQNIRKDLNIEMYNEAGQLVTSYKVFRCWVSEFRGAAEVDASANAVSIERL